MTGRYEEAVSSFKQVDPAIILIISMLVHLVWQERYMTMGREQEARSRGCRSPQDRSELLTGSLCEVVFP